MICEECRRFWIDAASSQAVKIVQGDVNLRWKQWEKTLSVKAAEVEKKARGSQAKCSICVCIWYSLSSAEQDKLPRDAACILQIHADQEQNKPSLKAGFVDASGNMLAPIRMIAMYDKESEDELLSSVLKQCGELSNAATGSEASFIMAHYWLRDCLDNHADCAKPARQGFMPTRVLDVGSDGDAGVVIRATSSSSIPNNERQFLALSHCWGKFPLLTTTQATLQDRMTGIELTALTPVFRDAIITTRKLGFRFLWIDSLCIIQDSKSDWEAESVQMCQIYQCAVLTIASAHSPDSQGGLFKARDGVRVVPFEIDLRLEGSESAVRVVRFTPATKREHVWDMRDLPLYTRAWCFQELVLAPRTLIFDFDLRWECLLKHGSERSPAGGISRHHNAVKAVQMALSPPPTPNTDGFLAMGLDPSGQAVVWQHVVEDYTARQLTKNSDRLIAIAGIADGLKAYSKNEYIAGIWKSQLPNGLLWFIRTYFEPPNGTILQRAQVLARSGDPIAPSWSWASCELPVAFNTLLQSQPMCEIKAISAVGTPHKLSGTVSIFGDTRTFYECSSMKSVIQEAEKLQKDAKYRFKGQYDLVQSLVRADAVMLLASTNRKWKYRVEAIPGRWYPDDIIDENTLITFIAIARSPLKEYARSIELRRPTVYTIAVVPVPGTDNYRRVGYAEWEDCAWFGYDCAEDHEHKKDSWKRLARSWNKIKSPELSPGHSHKHPVEHSPLPDLSTAYSKDAAVKRCTISII